MPLSHINKKVKGPSMERLLFPLNYIRSGWSNNWILFLFQKYYFIKLGHKSWILHLSCFNKCSHIHRRLKILKIIVISDWSYNYVWNKVKNSFDFIQNFRGKLGMIDIFDLETNNQNIQQQQNAYNFLTPRQNIYNM